MDFNIDFLFNTLFNILIYITSRIKYAFYLVNPTDCMFERVEDVPPYVEEMVPVFITLALADNGLRLLKGKPILRVNDSIASISQGFFYQFVRLKLRSFEVVTYCMVWNNYRMFTLNWDSQITWWICFLGVDLGFYVYHRLSHEVNLMWSVHQVHHSAEEYTITSALRMPILHPFVHWFNYLPLAFFVPPSIFLVHLQLSELYMIWLHTEVIETLGPLDLILNTPTHHKVHHGRNRKYIDKNFGGTLILWDRLFGTFEALDSKEPVAYGLVHPVESYNTFYLQFHVLYGIFRNSYYANGWRNKLSYMFKGPGWAPGKPRLGELEDVPLIQHPVKYWSPVIPLWQNIYSVSHFALVLIFYSLLTANHNSMSQTMITFCIIALLISITSIGFLFENRKFAPYFELLRCILFFYTSHKFVILAPPNLILILHNFVKYSFIFSAMFWFFMITLNLKRNLKSSLLFDKFEKISHKHRKLAQ